MKKLVLVLALVILFTGCEVKNITDKDINDVIESTLKNDAQGANNNFKGYKYYVPRGFSLQNKKGDNHVLLSNGDYYYLYVDIVSYYHRQNVEVTFDNDLYFSKKISYNGIDGYVKVKSLEKDIYYIEVYYNFSKIEANVKKENLNSALKNAIKILASITYNDVILDTMVGDKTLSYEEEYYDVYDSKREEGNFLEYIEEYDSYEKKEQVKDEDIISSFDE